MEGQLVTYSHIRLNAESHDTLLRIRLAGITEVLAAAAEAVLDQHQCGWRAIGQVPLDVVGCATDGLGCDDASGGARTVTGALGQG